MHPPSQDAAKLAARSREHSKLVGESAAGTGQVPRARVGSPRGDLTRTTTPGAGRRPGGARVSRGVQAPTPVTAMAGLASLYVAVQRDKG